jgi:hypothetical protein
MSLAGEGWRVAPGIADGEDLPEVAVGVLPVEVLPAQARVDLHVVLAARVAAVLDPGVLDAPDELVARAKELGIEERCRGEDLALSDVGGDHHLAACHLVELNQQP